MLYTVAVSEKRTQIYLSAEQHAALRQAARERGTSMAWVVREAVSQYIERGSQQRAEESVDPLEDLVGFVDGPSDLAARHDAYLYDTAAPRRREAKKRC